MVFIQRTIKPRKPTGARKKENRSKRLFEKAGRPTLTTISERETRTEKTKGGGRKQRTLSADTMNVFNPKTKKHEKTQLKVVLECASNRHFVRRNVLVKGAVVDTELGKARVTSRPGQSGSLEGVLL